MGAGVAWVASINKRVVATNVPKNLHLAEPNAICALDFFLQSVGRCLLKVLELKGLCPVTFAMEPG